MSPSLIRETVSNLIQAVQSNDENKTIEAAAELFIDFLSTQNRIADALEKIANKP